MDADERRILWRQFGAAIDMLANAMRACPEPLWSDRSRSPEFWYLAYHTLFWLDFYLEESPEGYTPPAPFGMEEMDPAGVIPERPYTQHELMVFLEHGRAKCRARIEALTADGARRRFVFNRRDLAVGELMLYSLRHVQHHAAQLNLLLRQNTDSAPRWVAQAKEDGPMPDPGGRPNP